MTDDINKKQKVIHTRVSDTLDEEIRRRAEGLGVSVSNLIRNVLGHSFGLVEDVIVDGARVARSARGDRLPPAEEPQEESSVNAAPPKLIGWTLATLELNALCDTCNAILARGAQGAISVYRDRGPAQIICTTCLSDRLSEKTHATTTT